MDMKWTLDFFNLTESTTLGELLSNLINMGDYSRLV